MFRFLQMTCIFAAILICCQSVSAQDLRLRGTVLDQNGAVISDPLVKISTNTGKISFCSVEKAGNFECKIDFAEDFVLEIQAEGFSILRQQIDKTQDFSQVREFRLSPAGITEQVVVSGDRAETTLGNTPESISIVPREAISSSAAPTMDDVLRQVPGFSIFRRSSSRNANPTTQGVSLRGVGASGASRSLVLLDGVPLNDPFGGWVQWNRVTPVGIERIEVMRGGASSFYGDESLSGSVYAVSRQPNEKVTVSAEVFGGTQRTLSGSAYVGFRRKSWQGSITAANFQTRGFIPIDENARGLVDVFAGVRSSNLSARIEKTIDIASYIFFRPSVFGEVRTNGTGLQTNRTSVRQFVAGGMHAVSGNKILSSGYHLNWRVYGGTQVYDQIFSAVSADRSTESLNRIQRVPAQTFGFSARFTTNIKKHALLLGTDGREVRGASDERVFANGINTSTVGAGGRERTFGFLINDIVRVAQKFVISGTLRYDTWQNYRALSATHTFANNQVTTVNYPDRSESAFSPQVSILYEVTPNFSLRAAASKSFRAPTLNELYRNFRVGNVLTLSNENLRAERADNFETGAIYSHKKTYIRGTAFWINIDQPVGNITLTSTPSLITRQRQNAGQTRSRGIEADAETSVWRFKFSGGYLFTRSTVTRFPANVLLEGLWIPQVPRHQASFQARYSHRHWLASIQARASGQQFDDDQNAFRLEPYFQLDAFVSRKIGEKISVFAGIENVFNSRYSVGRTPIRTVSSPTNLRVGLRWN